MHSHKPLIQPYLLYYFVCNSCYNISADKHNYDEYDIKFKILFHNNG